VIATPLTVKEDKLKNLLQQVDDDHRVDLLPLPQLVLFAESGKFEGVEVEAYLRKELFSYHLEDYSALCLGCTHFNYFKDTLRQIFPSEVEFIDGSEGTVKHLINILQDKSLLEHNLPAVEYYESGRLVTEQEALERFAQLHKRLEDMLQY
jgi:glutamate racemase